MSIKIAIVEDSQENIDILLYMLNKSSFDFEITGIAKTINEANLLLSRPDIDVALLDIQLKEGTIFDVLENINSSGKINYDVVFVTAHGSYENALKAIQYSCLDFINKPIDESELYGTLEKIKSKVSENQNQLQIKHLLELIRSDSLSPKTIGIVLAKGVIEFVNVNDIVYIEADQTICRLYFSNGEKMTSSKHLGYYIELLSDAQNFVQSSKSHLVNLNQIKQYDHRERTIRFNNGEHLIASFRYSKEIRKDILDRQSKGGFFGNGLDRLTNLFK